MLNAEKQFSSLDSGRIEKFERLSELLRQENQVHNLTRIIDPDEIRLRHFCDSLAVVGLILAGGDNPGASIIDIGSGAGFPGIALAIAMPEIEVTSVEATGKKVNFQKKAAAELGLDNFTPIHARAEELGKIGDYRGKYDFAVSRAVADLAVLCELCLPFVKPGGYFFAWKGKKAADEIENAESAVEILGGEIIDQTEYTLNESDKETGLRIITIKKIAHTPPKYPRKYKAIKLKPL